MPVTGRSVSPGSEKIKEEAQRKEKEREEQENREEEVLRLQTQCKEQNAQLLDLRAELKRTVLGLDVLAICTKHFCLKVLIAYIKIYVKLLSLVFNLSGHL